MGSLCEAAPFGFLRKLLRAVEPNDNAVGSTYSKLLRGTGMVEP